MVSIVFTGGGTAGHVTPNLAIINSAKILNWQVSYIGSYQGIEKDIIKAHNIDYYSIHAGKLRRYFSFKTFGAPFLILIGILQSFFLLRKLKTQIVFSKGGFVAFPVVAGAWLNRIPVVAHESDFTPGLANRLSFPFVKKICVTFAGAAESFKNKNKIVVTGSPLRENLFKGIREKGIKLCGFVNDKPTILIIGGGQGSILLNSIIHNSINDLLVKYQIIHICGPGKLKLNLMNLSGYKQFEFVDQGLEDLFAACDLVISRSGSNSLYEILALAKPHILIPLSRKSSRGDQIENAAFFAKQKISMVIHEEQLNSKLLLNNIDKLFNQKEEIIKKIKSLNIKSGTTSIINILKSFCP